MGNPRSAQRATSVEAAESAFSRPAPVRAGLYQGVLQETASGFASMFCRWRRPNRV